MTTAFQANSAINMDGLTTTLFEKEDIPALCAIEATEFSTPFKEKDFLSIYESEISNVLVAKLGEAFLVYVSFTIIIDECQIINFATKNEFKRQGVAKKVMEALISLGDSVGVKKYFLEVRVSNAGAIALYEKYGFKTVGVSKNHFSLPREDALLMNLEL